MDSEVDRAQSVLRAIPQMSREIVDDTMYEKVFSFLKGFVECGRSQLLDSWGVFDILLQACEQKDQDYRVINLCYRILGLVVGQSEKDNASIFDKLQSQHGHLLDRLVSDINNPQPAVRCAVLEALYSCMPCNHAAQWLLELKDITKAISVICTDGSTYIIDQFCQLYSLVLKLSSTSATHRELQIALNPSKEIKCILQSAISSTTVVNALDFCYSVANMRTNEAWKYMLDENLLQPLLPLLCKEDRLANDRILEILNVIFDWTPDPLLLLAEKQEAAVEDKENPIERAYNYIRKFSETMALQVTSMSTLQTAVSLLETSAVLLQRLKTPAFGELYETLRNLLLLCIGVDTDLQSATHTNILRLLKRSISAKKSFLHEVLRALQNILKVYSFNEEIRHLSEDILAILKIRKLSSDKRVLQPALELLGGLLDQISSTELIDYTQSQLSKSIDILVDMLNDFSMSSQNVSLILKFISKLLTNDNLSAFMLDPMTSGSLMNALELMIMNPEWDARDDAISFVGSLFDPPSFGAPITFALSHDLPLQVIDLIQDPDTFVRASAVEMLEKMMQVPEGWMYIQQHQRTRDIARKLPSLLYDPESYVRRAALGSISCLISNRSCEGMIIERDPLHDKESLNKALVDELMGDPDSEVRSRVCRMLLALWNLHLHTSEQAKRSRSEGEKLGGYQPLFYILEGDKRLLEATEDTHRLVRKEAIHAIRKILQDYPTDAKVAHKRKYIEDTDADEELLRKFAALDLNALEESTLPEHLYAEALDISTTMMTSQTPLENVNDDGNRLDCYN